MLTLRQLLLIKLSWSQLSNRLGSFGEEFYTILFTRTPSLRPMFQEDMAQQEEKFSVMMNFIVSKIQFLDSIEEELKEMGVRHRGYGVRKEHYQSAQEAIIEALKIISQENAEEETLQAWREALSLLIEKIDP